MNQEFSAYEIFGGGFFLINANMYFYFRNPLKHTQYMALLGFIGQQLASYGFTKGLDKIFDSKDEFTVRLNNVISKSIEICEKQNPVSDKEGKYAFYKSKELVTELLKYRLYTKDGYELSGESIQHALEINPKIITPSVDEMKFFISTFDSLVKEDEKLKKLEIDAFHDEVIFEIYREVKKQLNFLETHLLEVIPLLEEEYKEELNTYIEELKALKPKSALNHIKGLSERVERNSKHVSSKIQASLQYFKGVCYEALSSSNDAFECFINAYKVAPENKQYRAKACISYYKLGKDEYKELKKIIDSEEEFNAVSWAISTLESDDPITFIKESVHEIVLQKNHFKRLVFNNILHSQKANISSLIKVLSISGIGKELPNEINYDNLHHWVFAINSLSIQFFNSNQIDYLRFLQKSDKSLQLLNLSKVLSDAIIGSELDNSYYSIVFIYHWLRGELDPQPETLFKLKESYSYLKESDQFRTLLLANSIRKHESDEAAIEFIDSYKGELDENLIALRTFCRIENPVSNDSVLEYFKHIDRMDDDNAANICGFILSIGKFKVVKKEDLTKVLNNIEYAISPYKELVNLLVDTLYNSESEIDIDRIDSLKDNLPAQYPLKFFIALLYYENNHLDKCISYQESYVDENRESRDLRLYMLALNSRGTTNQLKLLSLLKKWRTSYSFDDFLIRIEIEIRQILDDWDELLSISEYGLRNKPSDEVFLTLYIIALSRTDNPDRLTPELEKIRDFDFSKTENALSVAQVLIQFDHTHDGIEVVYNKAVNKADSIARVNFFMLSNHLPQEYLIDESTVQDGSFVKYEVDGEIETIYINSETINHQIVQGSLGKKVSDTFVLKNNMTSSLKTVKVMRIMNKYLALLDEILKEANSSFSNLPMGTVHFDPTDFKSIEKVFVENFGTAQEESRKQKESNVESYYRYEKSFTELVSQNFDGSFISGYYSLTSDQYDGYLVKPIKYFLDAYSSVDKTLVLDLSSGILLYELSRKLGNVYKPFTVSGNLYSLIEEEIRKTESMSNSGMSISISENRIIPHFYPEDFHDNRMVFLQDLKNWFSENSISVIPEEKIDIVRPLYKEKDMKRQLDYVIDNAFLAQREKHLLITDDIIYENKLKIGNWFTTERFLINEFPEKKVEILCELVNRRYVGISINTDVLYEAYLEQHKKGSNHIYSYALRNLSLPINFSPFNIFTSVDFLKQLALNPTISQEKYKFEATNLLFMLISSFPKSEFLMLLKTKIEQQFYLLGEYYDITIKAIIDAVNISNSSR